MKVAVDVFPAVAGNTFIATFIWKPEAATAV
jgi:hypothetical protein